MLTSDLSKLSPQQLRHQQLRKKMRTNKRYFKQLRFYRVIALALSAFIFNTTEFVPIALLSDIGRSFAMPVESVGFMITIYAWIVALLSLPAMLATAAIERKKLLLGLFAIFISGHIISVVASSFGMLLVGRALIALAHAVFWSITAALAVRVAPRGKQTQALGLLAVGSAMATVLGLPLGRMIGQWLGWRMTFATIAILAFLAMLILAWILPKLPSKNVGSLASLPTMLANKPLLVVYLLTVLMVTGHFTAYSYVEPYIIQLNHFSENFATLILLIFGGAGLLASFLFGHFYERFPNRYLTGALMLLLTALLNLPLITGHSALWLGESVLWGLAITSLSLVLQLRVLALAPKSTDVAMSIFSGLYNVGIGGGALLGSLVISQLGLGWISEIGSTIIIAAIFVWLIALKRTQTA